jgi:adenosylcobinamide-phosphate guanylyltransferase
MSATAVVMAGGKGTRMVIKEEKPLLQVGSKPVIAHVIAALKAAKKVNRVVVAVSNSTPKTAKYLKSFSVEVIITPGKEYVSDMAYVVKTLKLTTILGVAADLPLLNGEIIDDIVEAYFNCDKPTLAVAVPQKTKTELGMSLGYAFDFNGELVVPAGINMIDGTRIDEGELDQAVYIVNKAEVALNINTVEELEIAQDQFARFSKRAP